MCCACFVHITFQAINKFAWARHPGIYKQDYIDALYMFYHEKTPEDLVCPQTPEWKRLSEPDFHGVAVPAVDNHGDNPPQVHAIDNYGDIPQQVDTPSTGCNLQCCLWVEFLTWVDAWKLTFHKFICARLCQISYFL